MILYFIVIQFISVNLLFENVRYCIYLSSLSYHISPVASTVSTAIKHIAHFVKHGFETPRIIARELWRIRRTEADVAIFVVAPANGSLPV